MGDWPLANRSVPAARPANAAPCFRNRLRSDRLEYMISSRDFESRLELRLGANAQQTPDSVKRNHHIVNPAHPTPTRHPSADAADETACPTTTVFCLRV